MVTASLPEATTKWSGPLSKTVAIISIYGWLVTHMETNHNMAPMLKIRYYGYARCIKSDLMITPCLFAHRSQAALPSLALPLSVNI